MKTINHKTTNENINNHVAKNDILIYDIETNSLDTETAEMKFFGCYSYKYERYFLLNAKDDMVLISQLIKEHKIMVGFNNKYFDRAVMMNKTNGYDMTYKICFDCLQVLYNTRFKNPNRENVIKVKGKTIGSILPNRKLKTIAEVLGFPTTKGDIDYRIFKKDYWTDSELEEINKYLFKDVEITKMLFEFYVDYFEPFKEYVDIDNHKKLNYIRSSLGSYVYSGICHMANIPMVYEQDEEKRKFKPENHGGFVLPPQVKHSDKKTLYLDFSSLYPSIFIQCNLFSTNCNCCSEEEKWNGDGFFDVKGKYCSKTHGKIEKLITDIFIKRIEYKKIKNPRELALKIFQNTLYGIASSPTFVSIYHEHFGGDTTAIGRKSIQYTKEEYEKEGFKVIYGDTDSVFVEIPEDKTKDEAMILAKKVVQDLQSHFPFIDNPVGKLFKLDIDDEFKKLWLYGKKQYVGINIGNNLVIKGLPIIKHDSSMLGQKMLNILKPLIVERQDMKFDKSYLDDIALKELEKDITIIARSYNVKSIGNYKSNSSIQAQISSVFGEGTHLLIANKKVGRVGKGKKYATLDEARELEISDLYLDKLDKELNPFVKA